MAQTKEKLSNSDLFKPIKRITLVALEKHFEGRSKELKKLTDIVKNNAKARIKSQEVRKSVLRGETSNLDEHRIANFIPANSPRGHYKELYIVEGVSASGSGRNGRDPKSQALYCLNGVPPNTFKSEVKDVLDSKGLKELVAILGCNIGEKFNLRKLKYDKVIIMSDSDIDGFKITSLIATFFIKHLPAIVRHGKLFKTVSPLYALKEKNAYVMDKTDFARIFQKNISQSLVIYENNVKMDSTRLKEFLLINRNYLDELIKAANQLAVHPQLLEYIIYYRKDRKFSELIAKKFPEVKLKDNLITGIHEGRFQSIILDHIFEKTVAVIDKLIFKINKDKFLYNVDENNGVAIDHLGDMSIGDILYYSQKYMPKIKTRFKGLGELNSSQLWDTTMNPNKRHLMRLTIKDIEEDLAVFNLLHGYDNEGRKELMHNLRLERDEIDN